MLRGTARRLSALAIDPRLFEPSAAPASILALNAQIEANAAGTPPLHTGSAQAARAARAKQFEHEFRRIDTKCPGLNGAPDVPLSVFVPADRPPRASYLHMHGGGWKGIANQASASLPNCIAPCMQLTSAHV